MSGKQLSLGTGIPESTISEWLGGRTPKFNSQIRMLAKFLDVSVDSLIDEGSDCALLELVHPQVAARISSPGTYCVKLGETLRIGPCEELCLEERPSIQNLLELKNALDQHAIVAATDTAGRITYVNDMFCDISRYSRNELIGQDHRILNSRYHPPEFFKTMWRTIAGGKVWKGEVRNRAKDGSFYWVSSTIVPFLDQGGRPCQYVSIRSDITKIKEQEDHLLLMTQALDQELKKSVERFLTASRTLEIERELKSCHDRFISRYLGELASGRSNSARSVPIRALVDQALERAPGLKVRCSRDLMVDCEPSLLESVFVELFSVLIRFGTESGTEYELEVVPSRQGIELKVGGLAVGDHDIRYCLPLVTS